MKFRLSIPGLAILIIAVGSVSTKESDPLRDVRFPRVYSSTIPSSAWLRESADFTGKLDLLDFTKSNECHDCAEVNFLVHSHQELSYLKNVAKHAFRSKPIELVRNVNASQRLVESASRASFGEDRKTQENGDMTSYSTIRFFPCYRDLAGMEQFMVDLKAQGRNIANLNVTLLDIGDSYLKTRNTNGGYDIWALVITGNGVIARNATTEKGVLCLVMGIHPREYAPPELGARFAELLVNGYGSNATITSMLDHTEVHLILQANPDGRFVAETQPFLWRRKNMNGNAFQCGEDAFGVDLNRNFPFRWGLDSGSSSNPCSALYRGVSPASEPETQAIVNYASSIFPTDQRKADPELQINEAYPESSRGIFTDIHSYGEYIIWPWGHQDRETPNGVDLKSLVDKHLFFNGHGFSGPTLNFMFVASGATDDWAYGALGSAAMTFEVGTEFYEECDYFENEILPGNLEALFYSATVSTAPYLLSKGPDVTNITLLPQIVDVATTVALVVTADVSDRAYSVAGFSSSQQSISSVQLFLDAHPYDLVDGNAATGLEMSCNCVTGAETATISLFRAQILEQIVSPTLGRHAIYIQGTDSDGYAGPVAATFFEIIDSMPGSPPSSSPTESPSDGNSSNPTEPPSGGDSSNPTESPSRDNGSSGSQEPSSEAAQFCLVIVSWLIPNLVVLGSLFW